MTIKVIFVIIVYVLFYSCTEIKFTKGHNLSWNGTEIQDTFCPTKSCDKGRKDYRFSKQEFTVAIKNRAEFEYMNASKMYDLDRENNSDLVEVINFYDKLRNTDLDKWIDKQIAYDFAIKENQNIIYSSISNLIFMQE